MNDIISRYASNSLHYHYNKLSTSISRLSSSLRINSAADDAAGLAIRELQRADIAALHTGVRNVTDAISLLQTADGALGIIDEKLIRMKELAEQAATGTYDSTQRLLIYSEFQQMGSEINRIAAATDFNGIALLDGSLSSNHNGRGIKPKGAIKVHFGSENDSAEDYYYIDIGKCSCDALFPQRNKTNTSVTYIPIDWPGATINGNRYEFSVTSQYAGNWEPGIDYYVIPSGLTNIEIKSNGYRGAYHKPHVNLFAADGTQLTGFKPEGTYLSTHWNNMTGNQIVQGNGFAANAVYDESMVINSAGQTVTYNGLQVTTVTDQTENPRDGVEIITIDQVTNDLVFLIGGHNNPSGGCNRYDLSITCDLPVTTDVVTNSGIPEMITQEDAQLALHDIDIAIQSKDTIRAHLGALQNRLENTLQNLNVQSRNLDAAESRISDLDIANEMLNFVRHQIKAQAATAILAQANSFSQIALQLLNMA